MRRPDVHRFCIAYSITNGNRGIRLSSQHARYLHYAHWLRIAALAILILLGFTLPAGRLTSRQAFAAPAAQAATLQPPIAPTEDLNRIRQSRTIVIGTSADYAPFAFYKRNFALDGFDIQLMKEIG